MVYRKKRVSRIKSKSSTFKKQGGKRSKSFRRRVKRTRMKRMKLRGGSENIDVNKVVDKEREIDPIEIIIFINNNRRSQWQEVADQFCDLNSKNVKCVTEKEFNIQNNSNDVVFDSEKLKPIFKYFTTPYYFWCLSCRASK